jgi:exonuclease-1
MLQHFGVTPYIIFDGDYLPSKAGTETDRARRREESRRAGLELLNAGKTSQAYLEFQKAVDVTPEMARQFIDELKRVNVQYIVAPYEADAQMVYLEREGILDGIISEDSDLLVFGARCLLTKLDQYGNCIEINKADFCACKEINLTGWSDREFRRMAILSGCDYLASINNMGLKTAYRMVRKYKTIEKVIRMLQFDGKFHVPIGYLEAFHQAELTFLHQRVFCPKKLRLVFHTEPEQSIEVDKMPFIGADVEPEIAQGVARGDLNPMTKLPIVVAKRNHMATPSTPGTSRPQHQRSTSAADSKKGKPIDTFFKPKRIPLAELDPNCFTPSPSQQEALSRNTGPWLNRPVRRPYLTRSSTEPQIPQSMPPPVKASRSHARAPSVSEPRPSKRTRLCADVQTIISPSQKIELGPSPFFSSMVPEPSPSTGRHIKTKRPKKYDVTIFSDDSIEEAMLSLPDFDGFSKGSGSGDNIQVFTEKDVEAEAGDATCGGAEEGSSQGATDSYDSQKALPSLTSSSSVSSSAEQPSTPIEAQNTAPIERLKERFAFAASTASTPKSQTGVRGFPTPSSSSLPRSRIPLSVNSCIHTAKASQFFGSTPLQRLGASATNRSRLPMTPPTTPTLSTLPAKPKSPRRSLLSKNGVPFPEMARESKLTFAEPASIPLPVPDYAEALALGNGSEDLIIHDSEGEEDALSPIAGDDHNSRIDLGAFVYTPRA